MSDKRNEEINDVPTFIEEGIDIDYGAFRGLAVPANTPKDVIEALDKAFEGMINDSRYKEKMAKAGYPLVYKGANDFTDYVNQNASDLLKIIPLLNQ
jgi:tripartite-type tricarboxylate transporter receptor subunit TctC